MFIHVLMMHQKRHQHNMKPVEAAEGLFRRIQFPLKQYCQISTLHGFRNIAAEKSTWLERSTWFVIVVSCCVLTITMTHSVWHRFQISPTMTTIQSNHHPIEDVPFPAVTICNTNVIVRSSANVIIDKLVEKGINRSHATQFLKQLPQAINNLRPLNVKLLRRIENATRALGYTFESLLFELSQPCSRLLHQCLWMGIQHNCSSMFVHLPTSEGFCCSFNWHGSVPSGYKGLELRKEEILWKPQGIFRDKLLASAASVPSAGLAVIINTELEEHFSSVNSFLGAAVLLHHPDRYPDIYVRRTFVQPRSEATIRITGSIVESSTNVRSLSPQQRQCYFQDEMSLHTDKIYNYDSCTLDCKMATYQAICGCVPFYYPNITETRTCDLRDWRCLYDHRGILSSQNNRILVSHTGQNSQCNCLPSCTEVNYDFFAQGNNINQPEYASPDFGGDLSGKSSFSVFFQDNVCIKYRRVSQMTWDTLIASFGGILGLYLGGSVVSVIELVYYITFKLWRAPKDNNKRTEANKIQPKAYQINSHTLEPIWYLGDRRQQRLQLFK